MLIYVLYIILTYHPLCLFIYIIIMNWSVSFYWLYPYDVWVMLGKVFDGDDKWGGRGRICLIRNLYSCNNGAKISSSTFSRPCIMPVFFKNNAEQKLYSIIFWSQKVNWKLNKWIKKKCRPSDLQNAQEEDNDVSCE